MKTTLGVVSALLCILCCEGILDGSYYEFAHRPSNPLQDNAQGVFLTEAAQSDNAVCLDGSPGAYYHRPGTGTGANKWYIHHEGGGWCYNLDDCYNRAKTTLGSSKTYPKTMNLEGGYFDTNPTNNPLMYNWNGVYLRYCDGNSFSGSNSVSTPHRDAVLHWRGKHILEAMISDLLTKGLATATDVMVSGCSAGGLATFLHCDHWAERLAANTNKPKVACLPDSGFFLDYEGGPRYHTNMIWAFTQQNSSSGVNQACIQARTATNDAWKCMFAEHTVPYIKTPIFPMQSAFDTWQVPNDLGSNDPKVINQWGANLTKLVQTNLLNQPQHGIFLDSCSHHCGAWNSIRIDGDLVSTAIEKWYNGGSKKAWNQNQQYPCAACCRP